MAGGIRVVAIYAKLLAERGHQVFCLAVTPPGPRIRTQIKSLVLGKGIVRTPPPRNHFQEMGVPCHFIHHKKPARDSDVPDADILIATWWETAEWVAAMSPSKGRKFYLVQHHEVFDYTPKDRVMDTYRLPLKKIVVAGWLAEVMKDRYGDASSVVIPNAIDPHLFNAPVRNKQRKPTVGMMYATQDWKGSDIGIAAVKEARKACPDLEFVVFSNEKVSDALLLPENTRFEKSPSQQRITELYASCDAWLFCSRNEGFGLPILEALACRTPVIGTPTGAAPDLLTPANGALLKHFDPVEMAEQIVKITGLSDSRWAELSEAARQTAAGYTWEDAVLRFEAALAPSLNPQG